MGKVGKVKKLISLRPDMVERIDKEAKAEYQTRSEYVQDIFKDHFKRLDGKRKLEDVGI